MTGAERLRAAARGGAVDRRPTLSFDLSHATDGVIATPDRLLQARAGVSGRAVLALIPNPFARARVLVPHLSDLLAEDPEAGAEALDQLREAVLSDAEAALGSGADGIAYHLDGAYPEATTPMEYGGHFLEVDRSILTALAEAPLNLVYVEGDTEPYLDFVADLPAAFLGWNALAVTTDLDFIRRMRTGVLALDHPDADVHLWGTPAVALSGALA